MQLTDQNGYQQPWCLVFPAHLFLFLHIRFSSTLSAHLMHMVRGFLSQQKHSKHLWAHIGLFPFCSRYFLPPSHLFTLSLEFLCLGGTCCQVRHLPGSVISLTAFGLKQENNLLKFNIRKQMKISKATPVNNRSQTFPHQQQVEFEFWHEMPTPLLVFLFVLLLRRPFLETGHISCSQSC